MYGIYVGNYTNLGLSVYSQGNYIFFGGFILALRKFLALKIIQDSSSSSRSFKIPLSSYP
jgi:hypothetical protein